MQVTTTFGDPLLILNIVRIAIFIIFTLYAIFALLIVRQVSLMAKSLITPVSPIVKAIAIIHAGFAVGFVVFLIGTF